MTFKLFGIEPNTAIQLLKSIEGIEQIEIKYFKAYMETKVEIDDSYLNNYRSIISDIAIALNPYTYSTEDKSIYEVAAQYLLQRKKNLSILEQASTGRIISNLLTFDGVEDYITESYVMLSNESWIKHFEISPKLLRDTCRISSNTIYELAANIISKTLSDIILITIGVLRENNEAILRTMQPKGLVYIAIGDRNSLDVKKYNFTGSRNEIIEAISKTACWNLIKMLA